MMSLRSLLALGAIAFALAVSSCSSNPFAPKRSATVAAIGLPVAAHTSDVVGFTVTALEDGSYLVRDQPVAEADLVARFKDARESSSPSVRPIIVADGRVSWGRVVHVLDLLRQAGNAQLAFQVSAASKPRAVASLEGDVAWSCAARERSLVAVPIVQVTVAPNGSASDATVLFDPGQGLGDAARACALAHRYRPARDPTGAPIPSVIDLRIAFSAAR